MLLHFKICSLIYYLKDEETNNRKIFASGLLSKSQHQSELGQAKTQISESTPEAPIYMAGTQVLESSLLLPRVYVSKRSELGARVGTGT